VKISKTSFCSIILAICVVLLAFSPVDARVRNIASASDIESLRFLSPNNMPLKVLVVYLPDQKNENFVVSLINIVAQMHESGSVKQDDSFKVHIIPGWQMTQANHEHLQKLVGAERVKKFVEFNNRFSTQDMWMQDWGEVGVIKLKGERKPQTVVFDSNRGRGIGELPGILASFWNSYLVKNPSNQFSGGDYGGNIEVTPDNILLIGNTSTQALRDYLEKNGYRNRMAVLETDWLTVGHVDEYISVCPNPKAARGYTLIKANPRLALRMIKNSSEAEINKVPHKEYRKALLRIRHYLHRAEIDRAKAGRSNISASEKGFAETVLDYIEKPDSVDETLPAMLSGASLSSDHEIPMSQVEEFIKLNLTIGNLIDTNVKTACQKISQVTKSGKSHSIISFPALYRKTSGNKHIAYLPGSVNQLILNDQLIVPDPKVRAMRLYIQKTTEKIGLHANFVDSLPYHNLEGQLHCGSNVFRHPNKYFVKPR
jgi:hypothetical protein